MPIGAVSLRTNNECCKPQTKKSQNFGRKPNEHEHKNHKAAYIAASVGAVAALAVTAYIFRGRIAELPIFKRAVSFGSEKLEQGKKLGEQALNTARTKGKKVVKDAQELGNKVVKGTENLAEKVKNGVVDTYNTAVEKGAEFFDRAKNLASKKASTFSKEDMALISKYKKTGANQQGVFDTLKKYGMNESEEKYIKETLTLLKEKFAQNGGKTKPVSMRTFINQSLKKESPEAVIVDILENSKNLRKTHNL